MSSKRMTFSQRKINIRALESMKVERFNMCVLAIIQKIAYNIRKFFGGSSMRKRQNRGPIVLTGDAAKRFLAQQGTNRAKDTTLKRAEKYMANVKVTFIESDKKR